MVDRQEQGREWTTQINHRKPLVPHSKLGNWIEETGMIRQTLTVGTILHTYIHDSTHYLGRSTTDIRPVMYVPPINNIKHSVISLDGNV